MTVIHEKSYQGIGIAQLVHRRRLRRLFKIFRHIPLDRKGTLADFGCSNGYIISLLKMQFFHDREYRFYGFDHSNELLKMAADRQVPEAEFQFFNLNIIDKTWENHFDITICLETLEHVGNVENAMQNLYLSCRKNGIIIISIPNEKGLPGIIKYFGRKIRRKEVYGDFFRDKNELDYIKHLFLNRPLDIFRQPAADSWGPHLGFDWEVFKRHLEDRYTHTGRLKFLLRLGSPMSFSFFYVLEKIG